MKPTRNVKYIIDGALRQLKESTPMSEASDDSYSDMFDVYMDMLTQFISDGYISEDYTYPDSINSDVDYTIPHADLITLLTKAAADYYAEALSINMMNRYTTAYNRLAESLAVPLMASNRIPSNYKYYNTINNNICKETNEI